MNVTIERFPIAAPAIEPASTSADPPLLGLADLLPAWQEEAEAAHRARIEQRPRGAVTGLAALDRALGGYLAPGRHMLHAGPGVGKTALALQIATTCGAPALIVTAEMAPLVLLKRLTARVTETPLGRLLSGELRPDDSLALARRAVEVAPLLRIADATRVAATPSWMLGAARTVRGEQQHCLVIVDSLHSWSARVLDGPASEYDRLAAGLTALDQLAAELVCPFLVIVERNRAAMDKGGLSAGAGHRGIEYGSESVWALDRDTDGRVGSLGSSAVTLRLHKNRHGEPDLAVRLRFTGALQRFVVEER